MASIYRKGKMHLPETSKIDSTLDRLRSSILFTELYGDDGSQVERWRRLVASFQANFDSGDVTFFSSPGRTELCGNHTDHNHGVVLAAAVNLDSIAVTTPTDDNRVTIFADGYASPFIVDLDNLQPVSDESATTAALIRGIASRLKDLGYRIGGFNACLTSDVLIGSGLSSSASIEVLIGTIFNSFYNDLQISAETIAIVGQYAENNFFGKPCGLMDQIACAVGGVVMIDFQAPLKPVIETVEGSLGEGEYTLLVVNTGGSHADLTDDYAAIPREMKAVAKAMGKHAARELDREEIMGDLNRLRIEVGDRAILRVLHFLQENERVVRQAAALKSGDFSEFLRLVNQSGNSSCRWLQNCYSPKSLREQSIMLALALTEEFLKQVNGGACRVHSGGFAGTIQVWLPKESLTAYEERMNGVFGDGAVVRLAIRQAGVTQL